MTPAMVLLPLVLLGLAGPPRPGPSPDPLGPTAAASALVEPGLPELQGRGKGRGPGRGRGGAQKPRGPGRPGGKKPKPPEPPKPAPTTPGPPPPSRTPGEEPGPTVPIEPGLPGTEPPAAEDVRVPGAPLHPDRGGPAGGEVLALCGSEAGFGLVVADRREGEPRPYVTRLDPDGRPREPERRIDDLHTGAVRAPTIVLGPDGAGALVWFTDRPGGAVVTVRTFAADGSFPTLEQPIGKRDVRARAVSEPFEPARLAFDPKTGRTAIVWRVETILFLALVDELGRLAAPVAPLVEPREPATGSADLAFDDDGRLIVAWPALEGTHFSIRTTAGLTVKDGFASGGGALGLAIDRPAATEPARGIWLLAERDEQRLLWHLDDRLDPDRDPLVIDEGPARPGRLTTWPLGPIVLFAEPDASDPEGEPGGVASSEAVEDVRFLRADGVELRSPIDLAELRAAVPTSAREPLLMAVGGDRLMCAWTVRGVGPPRVVTWILNPRRGQRSEPEIRAEGLGRARQHQPAVASDEERTRAIAVWSDERDDVSAVFARRFERGRPLGDVADEQRVDVPGHDGALHPAVAIAADGSYAVAWKERRDDGVRLMVRGHGPTGEPLGEPRPVDPGQATAATSPPALVALRGGRGYAIVWDRVDGGARIRHLTRDGAPGRFEDRLSTEDRIEHPALCLLDDGRAVAVWDGPDARGLHAVRGRLLAIDLRPEGVGIEFDALVHGHDWGPSVAPGREGGFVLTWTTGFDDERDVFARFYDGHADAQGPPRSLGTAAGRQQHPAIARLADRSWVVAWQDDLSGADRIVLRRLRADGRRLGPTVALEPSPETGRPSAYEPSVAAFGDGLLAAWVDVRRARGFDAYLGQLGPRFDALPAPEEAGGAGETSSEEPLEASGGG